MIKALAQGHSSDPGVADLYPMALLSHLLQLPHLGSRFQPAEGKPLLGFGEHVQGKEQAWSPGRRVPWIQQECHLCVPLPLLLPQPNHAVGSDLCESAVLSSMPSCMSTIYASQWPTLASNWLQFWVSVWVYLFFYLYLACRDD